MAIPECNPEIARIYPVGAIRALNQNSKAQVPSPMIDQQSIITRAGSAMAADLEQEIVLMSSENGNYYSLTRTSREIWRQLAQPISVAEVCRALHASYATDPELIDAETMSFLTHLHDLGLIERVGST